MEIENSNENNDINDKTFIAEFNLDNVEIDKTLLNQKVEIELPIKDYVQETY